MDKLWQYAYMAYDKARRQVTSNFSFDENKKLMQSYLIGPRKRSAGQE